MTNSLKITDSLYLVRQDVSKHGTPAKPIETPTNHILTFDCSGSMYAELPRIREQLKSKLPSLLKEGDTCSAIWFSGRGESGVLFEAEPVATLTDLKAIHATLDRWLKPCGLTGFKEPLEHAVAVVKRVSKKNTNPFAFAFLSDGCDNVGQRGESLKAAEAVGAVVQSATFVEYGYYADRNLLTAMAEKCGGSLIFAKDFQTYAPSFEALMKKTPVGGKRIELEIEGDVVGGFAYAMVDEDLILYALNEGSVVVPSSVDEVWYLASQMVGKSTETLNSVVKASLAELVF